MSYKEDFIHLMLKSDVLKFGDFKTKSGRMRSAIHLTEKRQRTTAKKVHSLERLQMLTQM